MIESYRREREFVLWCLGTILSRDSTSSPYAGAITALDWQWLINTCTVHRILAFVALALQQGQRLRDLDSDIRLRLEAAQGQAAAGCRLRQQQLTYVSGLLNDRRIPVVPLKGAALVHFCYADIPFREMADLDILVRTADLSDAFAALLAAGFRRGDVTPSKNRWQTRILSETLTPPEWIPLGRVPMVRDDLQVDVHFAPKYWIRGQFVGLDVSRMWNRSESWTRVGPNVRMLSPRDHLAFALLHTLESFCPRLLQLLDIGLMVHRYGLEAAAGDVYVDFPAAGRHDLDALCDASRGLSGRSAGMGVALRGGDIDYVEETYARFFSRRSIRREQVNAAEDVHEAIVGTTLVKCIRSTPNCWLFIAGYFLPCPQYYEGKGAVGSFWLHWRALVGRVWRVLAKRAPRWRWSGYGARARL